MAAPDATRRLALDIRGTSIKVIVDENGWFHAAVNDVGLSAETLAKLRDKLLAHTKRVTARVSVPALLVRSSRVKEGSIELVPITLTGIHAKDDDVLIRYDDNDAADRLSSWSPRQDVLKPLLADQKAEYLRLYTEHRRAEKAFEKFRAEHKLDPKAEVTAAIAKLTAEQEKSADD